MGDSAITARFTTRFPAPARVFFAERVTGDAVARLFDMRKTVIIMSTFVCSSLFGWAGMPFGLMTSFMLGSVGTGVGMYVGRRLVDRLEG
jgi:hypothetical protein